MLKSHKNNLPIYISDQGPIRDLHLGSQWIQGSMYRKYPLKLVHSYIERMMAWGLYIDPKTAENLRVVQLGLGAASLTKFCAQKLKMNTIAVEINPAVYHICRSSFALPDNHEKLSVLIEDAAVFVSDPAHQNTVDVLQVDLYDQDAAAPLLCSKAFYHHCQQLLSPQGCMTINIFGKNSRFNDSCHNIQSAFLDGEVLYFPPTREGNIVIVAKNNRESFDSGVLYQRAEWIEQHWDLPATRWVCQIKQKKATGQ